MRLLIQLVVVVVLVLRLDLEVGGFILQSILKLLRLQSMVRYLV